MNGQDYTTIKLSIELDRRYSKEHKKRLLKAFEDTVLEHGTQKAEIDRLSTALVAANAELVTERAAHAETVQKSHAIQSRLMLERDDARRSVQKHVGDYAKLEGRLAEMAEVIRVTLDLDEAREFTPEKYREMRNKGRTLLAAITSDAPAKADTNRQRTSGEDQCADTTGDSSGERFAQAAAGPASKPGLVVGQRYKLGELPFWSKYTAGDGKTYTRVDSAADAISSQYVVTLVSLPDAPSAKADEGKAESHYDWCMRGREGGVCNCGAIPPFTDPAPPALTREEVGLTDVQLSQVVTLLDHHVRQAIQSLTLNVSDGGLHLYPDDSDECGPINSVPCADILRAALSDGGTK